MLYMLYATKKSFFSEDSAVSQNQQPHKPSQPSRSRKRRAKPWYRKSEIIWPLSLTLLATLLAYNI
jgi:hypothetical protein